MTKSTITRERLEKIKSWRETYGAGSNVILPAEEAAELASIALAAMNSEPVNSNYRKLFTCTGCGAEGLDEPLETNCHCCVDGAHWVESRLYRHAQPVPVVKPVMFIDGDISTEDADKLAKVIREFNEEDERPLAKMARIIRENPHPTNECDMPVAQPAPVVPDEWTIADAVKFCKETGRQDAGAAMDAYNACRAAMLQAEPVTTANKLGNSPEQSGSRCGTKGAPALDSSSKNTESRCGNSPVIPDGYVMVPKEPTKEMLIRAVATMSGCAPSLVDESGEELEDMREVYLDILKVAPQLTIVENGDESQDIKDDVNIIISILKNGDWSDTDGFRGLKTEAGQALESEIEKIVSLIEPPPTTVIDAIDAHLLKIFQGERGGQLLQKVENNNWIPVSERLPEEGGRYWCYVEEQNSLGKSHYQWNCSWNGEIWGGAMMYGRVTHWMPLPAAPQEVKGE